MSIQFVTMPSGIAIAWFPNSLLLALFLMKNIKEWKYYIPFFIVAEIVADYQVFTLIQALQFSFINLFETMFGAYIIKKLSSNDGAGFTNTKYVLLFFLIGLTLMPAMSALFGAIVYHTQIDTQTTFFEFWRIWFFGDSIGILLLTPIMVLLKENYKSLKNYDFNIQNISIALLSIYLAIVLFSFTDINFMLPTTPLLFVLLLLWIVYKQGVLPGMIMALLITSIAIYYTSSGLGPFSIFGLKGTTIYLQEFIAILVITTLFFGVLHQEINESKAKLEELNKNLENMVKEKTKSLMEANQKLNNLASKDSLTNIFNRRIIDEFISKETIKSKRYNNSLALIMIDIDHFKEVNDKYGHQVGDEVILSLVDIISKNIRESDIFGRWGGEEFIILLPETNLNQATIVAQNIRKKVQEYRFDKVGQKTISLGVSEFNSNDDSTVFIKRVDDALYKAKATGRNRVVSL
nr:diguanylate cyclase [Sulfurimonas denitrificans]